MPARITRHSSCCTSPQMCMPSASTRYTYIWEESGATDCLRHVYAHARGSSVQPYLETCVRKDYDSTSEAPLKELFLRGRCSGEIHTCSVWLAELPRFRTLEHRKTSHCLTRALFVQAVAECVSFESIERSRTMVAPADND